MSQGALRHLRCLQEQRDMNSNGTQMDIEHDFVYYKDKDVDGGLGEHGAYKRDSLAPFEWENGLVGHFYCSALMQMAAIRH